MILLLVLVTLFVLLAIGAPVGFAMGISGALGLWLTGGPDMLMGILQTTPLTSVSSYELIPIPMFLLMAELVLVRGGAAGLLRDAAASFGPVPRGSGWATDSAGASREGGGEGRRG